MGKHLLSEGIESPTPWGKDAYDSFSTTTQENYQLDNEIAELKKEGASEKKIEAAEPDFAKRKEERKAEIQNSLKVMS